jgi:predicted RNA-binding protein with PUA-like domain
MRYWLFKSEPSEWSWDDQVSRGAQGEEWTGVRNYQARNQMREMTLGDLGFFYHSQKDKAVVGIVEVAAEAHPDSTSDDARWECVDIRAVRPFATPVTLERIKAEAAQAGSPLSEMILVRNSRLSVQPVTDAEWRKICAMGGTSPDGR